MNIIDYKTNKALDTKNKTENVKITLVNGTPALTLKKYNPDTGIVLDDVDQIGIDVDALKKKVAELQRQIDNVNELIADAEDLVENK